MTGEPAEFEDVADITGSLAWELNGTNGLFEGYQIVQYDSLGELFFKHKDIRVKITVETLTAEEWADQT